MTVLLTSHFATFHCSGACAAATMNDACNGGPWAAIEATDASETEQLPHFLLNPAQTAYCFRSLYFKEQANTSLLPSKSKQTSNNYIIQHWQICGNSYLADIENSCPSQKKPESHSIYTTYPTEVSL